jgi:hypothetical protein
MATTPVAPACPIRLVCFLLLTKGKEQSRRVFVDGEGQICADPQISRPGDGALSRQLSWPRWRP